MLRPKQPKPPVEIERLLRSLHNPAIAHIGLTVTDEGDWSLKVWLRKGFESEASAIQRDCHGQLVVFESENPAPFAKPAYPSKRE